MESMLEEVGKIWESFEDEDIKEVRGLVRLKLLIDGLNY
jgi:hypothetical protein